MNFPMIGAAAALMLAFGVISSPSSAATERLREDPPERLREDPPERLREDPPERLREDQRSALRYRLENLYNELDLLVRNQRASASDRARQERDFAQTRLFERIPAQDDLATMKTELREHARARKITLSGMKLLSKDRPVRPIPNRVLTDHPDFRLEPSQITQTLHLLLILRGDGPAIEDWIQSWPDDLVRLVEPERGFARPGLREASPGVFHLRVKAYAFRKVRFPRLAPRDPVTLLPGWARQAPARFARAEPELWALVQKIRAKVPETPPLYEQKGEFLLGASRMSFLLAKAKELSQVPRPTKSVALQDD